MTGTFEAQLYVGSVSVVMWTPRRAVIWTGDWNLENISAATKLARALNDAPLSVFAARHLPGIRKLAGKLMMEIQA